MAAQAGSRRNMISRISFTNSGSRQRSTLNFSPQGSTTLQLLKLHVVQLTTYHRPPKLPGRWVGQAYSRIGLFHGSLCVLLQLGLARALSKFLYLRMVRYWEGVGGEAGMDWMSEARIDKELIVPCAHTHIPTFNANTATTPPYLLAPMDNS